MPLPIKLDHCVIHVTDWERSNAFYTDGAGRRTGRAAGGLRLSLRRQAAQRARPGRQAGRGGAAAGAPGNSDLCFEWSGPIADAVAHLERCGVAVERGPMQRFGAKGAGTSVYFRDPDGSLMEFMSYAASPAMTGREKRPARTIRTSCRPIFRCRRTTAPRGICPA